MKIGFLNTVTNKSFINNKSFLYKNLSPLQKDTVSFGANKGSNVNNTINTNINMRAAEELIAQYQSADFEKSGQTNIPIKDLITVCKYCGCIYTDQGGRHSYQIITPLGQIQTITGHGDIDKKRMADPGLVNDVITAVKNLDKNFGELIFPDKSGIDYYGKAKKRFEDGTSAQNDTGKINYYQQKFIARKKKELQEQEKVQNAQKAKQAKMTAIDKSQIKQLQASIDAQTDMLKEAYETLEQLIEELDEYIEIGLNFENEETTLENNEELKEQKKNLKKQMLENIKNQVKEKQLVIEEEKEKVSYSDSDDTKSLEDKLNYAVSIAKRILAETQEFNSSTIDMISDMITQSEYKEKFDGIIAVDAIFTKLQKIRRAFKKYTKENNKDDEENVTLSKKLVKLRDRLKKEIKPQILKAEITPKEGIKQAETILHDAEALYDEYMEKQLQPIQPKKSENVVEEDEEAVSLKYQIIFIIKNVNNMFKNDIPNVGNAVMTVKPLCKPEEYEQIAQKYSDLIIFADSVKSEYNPILIDRFTQIKHPAKTWQGKLIRYRNSQNKIKTLINDLILMIGTIEAKQKKQSLKLQEAKAQENVETSIQPEMQPETTKEPEKAAAADEKISAEQTEQTASAEQIADNHQQPQKPAQSIVIPKNISAIQTSSIGTRNTSKQVSERPPQQAESSVEKKAEPQSTITPTAQNVQAKKQPASVGHSSAQKTQKTSHNGFNSEFADRLIKELAARMALLKINSVVDDFANEIESGFTTGEIKKLEQSTPDKYTQLIQNKIKELSQKNSVKQIRRAETFAVLSDISSKHPKTAVKLYNSTFSEINKAIVQIAKTGSYEQYKPNINTIERIYEGYRNPLSKAEVNTIFGTVSKYMTIDEADKQKLMQIISQQRKYMLQIAYNTSNSSLKTILLKTLMSDFDSANGTSYLSAVKDAVQKYEEMQRMNEKIKILDSISWDDSVW